MKTKERMNKIYLMSLDARETARKLDTNGWFEIKGNPISKIGVFDYLGSSLGENFEPNKIYKVYRSAEALSNPETIESFKLIPFIDDHPNSLLGSPDEGNIAAEEKGISGVTGEEIYFDFPYLRGNMKVFSEETKKKIESGKIELSPGYLAEYILSKGNFEGQEYEVKQINMRGNHLALVHEGRSGPDVRVLDRKEIFDEGQKVKEEEKKKEAADEGEAAVPGIVERLEQCLAKLESLLSGKKSEDNEIDLPEESSAEMYDKKSKDEEEDKEKEKKEDKKESMDAASLRKSIYLETAKRNQLADKLSWHIGSFDAAEMTLDEVAKYGLKELGLNCKAGHEFSVLDGYLAGAKVNNQPIGVMDHSDPVKSDQIENFLKGGK